MSTPESLTALVENANCYRNELPVPIIAFFGPTGSGKSTYINLLREEYSYNLATVQIVTTRAQRQKETASERNCVSPDEFADMMVRGELTFVSFVYNNWHGARRMHLEELASSGKMIVFDPNQFPRLDMIKQMFPCSQMAVFYFLPNDSDYLSKLDYDGLMGIFEARVEPAKRVTMSDEEYQERMTEAVETTQEVLRRLKSGEISRDEVVVNAFSTKPEQIYTLIRDKVKREFRL